MKNFGKDLLNLKYNQSYWLKKWSKKQNEKSILIELLKIFGIFDVEKILVTTYNYSSCIIWWTDNFESRFSCSTFYLYYILVKTILGISAFYHDSAASILIDGKITAAAQEERFTRIKHDSSYPYNAIEFVLNYTNLKLNQIDQIVFFEKPFLKFERLLETYVAFTKGFGHFAELCDLA